MDNNILSIEHITKSYKEDIVLKDISLSVCEGDFIAIKGESGSGKSTLLNCIAGFTKIDSGRIVVCNLDLTKFSQAKYSDFRLRNIGFVFQQYKLINELTIRENIILPLLLRKLDISDYDKRVDEVLELINLKGKENKYPTELSGGQNQRVSLARAIITNPKIILADEPTGNLDSKNSNIIMELLRRINKKTKTTILLVTHSDKYTDMYSRVIKIRDGEIYEDCEIDVL